jgi:peptidyl-tRNA hydrolase
MSRQRTQDKTDKARASVSAPVKSVNGLPARPQPMNESGLAVSRLVKKYSLKPDELIVITMTWTLLWAR